MWLCLKKLKGRVQAQPYLFMNFVLLLPQIAGCIASPLALSTWHNGASNLSTVYEFPNGTWVENLAVRHDGRILVTILEPTPDLYIIDPSTGNASLVHHFNGIQSLTGITEYEPDRFVVAGGNFSSNPPKFSPGSWNLWTIDMHGPTVVNHLVNIPEALLLNGATTFNGSTVLVSDSFLGVIYAVDLQTGTCTTAVSSPDLQPRKSGSGTSLGVNGIRYGFGNLYFVNTALNIFGYFRHNAQGQWNDDATIVFNGTGNGEAGTFDEFAIRGQEQFETGFFVRGAANTVIEISRSGTQEVTAGSANSNAIAGATSAQLGRTKQTMNTLYLTTTGGLEDAVHTLPIIGGQVLALNLQS